MLWQLSPKQNLSPFITFFLTIRTPRTTYIDAKSARCWKYSPTDTHIHFPLGSNFQRNRNAVATGLYFIKTLCTRSESNLPILIENNKNHQITLPEGTIGFFPLTWLIETNRNGKSKVLTSQRLLSSLLMNDTMTAFSYIQQFQPRAVMSFSRISMELKIHFFNDLIQSVIAYLLTLE